MCFQRYSAACPSAACPAYLKECVWVKAGKLGNNPYIKNISLQNESSWCWKAAEDCEWSTRSADLTKAGATAGCPVLSLVKSFSVSTTAQSRWRNKKLSYFEMKQEFPCFSLCLLSLALFAFTTEKSLAEAPSFRQSHHVSRKSARHKPVRRAQCEYSCLSVVEMARLRPQNTTWTGHKSPAAAQELLWSIFEAMRTGNWGRLPSQLFCPAALFTSL